MTPMKPGPTPLDFFFRGHLKNKIFATPPATIQELKRRITIEIQNITQKTLRKVFQNMMRRAHKNLDGVHFQHMLSFISLILDNIDPIYKFHDLDQ